MSFVIYNGKIIQKEDFSVNIDNRAFTYGDGFFETIVAMKGNAYFFDDHFQRIKEACNSFYMHMPSDFSIQFIQNLIKTICNKNNLEELARLKIMVWRKSGGLFTPETNEVDYLISASIFNPSPDYKEKVSFYEDIRTGFSAVSPFKTLNAIPYVLASAKKKESGTDDMILLDREGYISECTAANIFFISENKIFTPDLSCGCIAGITRKKILEICLQNNISLKVGKFSKEDLLRSGFVFTSNVAGLSIVKSIEDRAFSSFSDYFSFIKEKLEIMKKLK